MSRYGMACSVVIWVEYCMVSHSMVWLFAWNMVWYGMVWHGMVSYDVVSTAWNKVCYGYSRGI